MFVLKVTISQENKRKGITLKVNEGYLQKDDSGRVMNTWGSKEYAYMFNSHSEAMSVKPINSQRNNFSYEYSIEKI